MARLLVTGGAGFIGANFVHHWLGTHAGEPVVVLDALTYAGNLANLEPVKMRPELRFVRGDIRDTALVECLLREERLKARISFEYIMFEGVNDSPRHARELVRILHGIECRVNLIHFHRIPGTPLAPTPADRMVEFENQLKQSGIMATIRKSRGEDIQAACGLLSTKELLRPQPVDY